MKLDCLHLVILPRNVPTSFWQYLGSLGLFLSMHFMSAVPEGMMKSTLTVPSEGEKMILPESLPEMMSKLTVVSSSLTKPLETDMLSKSMPIMLVSCFRTDSTARALEPSSPTPSMTGSQSRDRE